MAHGTGTRRRPTNMLGGYGLADHLVQAVVRLGQRLRDQTIRDRLEHAVLVNDRTGVQLGGDSAVVTGSEDRVSLAPLMARREQGQRYVCVHTHPHSMPPSLIDAALLVAEAQVRIVDAVVVIGRDGAWYVLGIDSEKGPPTAEALRAEYARAADATEAAHAVPEASPPSLISQARCAHMHDIWLRAAPALGLRYDRVEAARPARAAGRRQERHENGGSPRLPNGGGAHRGRSDGPS